MEIGKAEKEVLKYLTKYFKTPLQIAKIRGTSHQSVYKTIKKLRDKGLLKTGYIQGVAQGLQIKGSRPLGVAKKKKVWRPHAYQWLIKIVESSDKYEKARKKGNYTHDQDGNRVQLHKDAIGLTANKTKWLEHEDRDEAYNLTYDYWDKIFLKLEQEFNLLLVKPRRHNIRLAKHELAWVYDEIAEHITEKKQKLIIHDPETGKRRILVDKSHGNPELEFVLNGKIETDSTKLKRNVDELVQGAPTNGDLSKLIKNVVDLQKEHTNEQAINIMSIRALTKNMDKLLKKIE